FTSVPGGAWRGGFGESRAGKAGAPQSRTGVRTRIEARSKIMSLLIVWGNALWRDMFRLSLPVSEKILRAHRLALSGADAARLWQTRIGATESLRSGRVVDGLEHRAEGDRRRQIPYWRFNRRGRADGR